MTNPSVLFNLPELLNIIGDADNEIFEDNLLLINDAYQVLYMSPFIALLALSEDFKFYHVLRPFWDVHNYDYHEHDPPGRW